MMRERVPVEVIGTDALAAQDVEVHAVDGSGQAKRLDESHLDVHRVFEPEIGDLCSIFTLYGLNSQFFQTFEFLVHPILLFRITDPGVGFATKVGMIVV